MAWRSVADLSSTFAPNGYQSRRQFSLVRLKVDYIKYFGFQRGANFVIWMIVSRLCLSVHGGGDTITHLFIVCDIQKRILYIFGGWATTSTAKRYGSQLTGNINVFDIIIQSVVLFWLYIRWMTYRSIIQQQQSRNRRVYANDKCVREWMAKVSCTLGHEIIISCGWIIIVIHGRQWIRHFLDLPLDKDLHPTVTNYLNRWMSFSDQG